MARHLQSSLWLLLAQFSGSEGAEKVVIVKLRFRLFPLQAELAHGSGFGLGGQGQRVVLHRSLFVNDFTEKNIMFESSIFWQMSGVL
jgi:hypothetical protein